MANGFAVVRTPTTLDGGVDFVVSRGSEHWVAEVKHYRTDRAQPHLIEAAAAHLVSRQRAWPQYGGMLVLSCLLPPSMRLALEQKFSILFIDRRDLETLTAKQLLLSEELQALLGSSLTRFFTQDPVRQPDELFKQRIPPQKIAPAAQDICGTQLYARLNSVQPGRSAWTQYEEVCAQSLKYLFSRDLEGWHKQTLTDDGLNRFDFVCRVRPTTEFWRFLIDHLNSRYILFEFKNHSDKITQDQIWATEKYLYERALRRVAIIFTRKGADDSALKATQVAMREHGRLMLVLDDGMLGAMLRMKEAGDDPSDYLFGLADDFLLTLPK